MDRDRRLTYAEAAAGMERVAGALAALGVKKGDRVGIFAHNGIDYVLAMFGAWRLGAISAHVNVQYADTLDYYLVFGTFKMAVVLQQIYFRFHRGQTKDERFAGMAEGARALFRLADARRP